MWVIKMHSMGATKKKRQQNYNWLIELSLQNGEKVRKRTWILVKGSEHSAGASTILNNIENNSTSSKSV